MHAIHFRKVPPKNFVYECIIIISLGSETAQLPDSGTLCILSFGDSGLVLFSGTGGILHETNSVPKTSFGFGIRGSGTGIWSLDNVVILPNPSVTITHSNIFGEVVQSGTVLKEGVALVQNMWDDQGRQVASTKGTLIPWGNLGNGSKVNLDTLTLLPRC
jgi:hypothetical protein